MSNKIYKSKMKDENRLLGKFVNISLIAINYLCIIIFENNSDRNIIS